MTTLDDALRQIAAYTGLDADALIAYAAEDTFGGRGDFPQSGSMSITRAEGQIVYALVRALRPVNVVEVGCFIGVSSAHILAALDANGTGDLTSVDVERQEMVIPDALLPRWSLAQMDAREYVWGDVDFVMEDGDHTRDLTAKVLSKAIAHGAQMVISHDAHNASVGTEVRAGFEDVVGGDYITVMVDDVPLGLAIWYRGAK